MCESAAGANCIDQRGRAARMVALHVAGTTLYDAVQQRGANEFVPSVSIISGRCLLRSGDSIRSAWRADTCYVWCKNPQLGIL